MYKCSLPHIWSLSWLSISRVMCGAISCRPCVLYLVKGCGRSRCTEGPAPSQHDLKTSPSEHDLSSKIDLLFLRSEVPQVSQTSGTDSKQPLIAAPVSDSQHHLAPSLFPQLVAHGSVKNYLVNCWPTLSVAVHRLPRRGGEVVHGALLFHVCLLTVI